MNSDGERFSRITRQNYVGLYILEYTRRITLFAIYPGYPRPKLEMSKSMNRDRLTTRVTD